MASFYWFTDTFPRSLYHAQVLQTLLKGNPIPISKEKPLGYSQFSRDLALLPKAWVYQLYPNLVFFKAHEMVRSAVIFISQRSLINVRREGILRGWSNQWYS